MWQNVIFQPKSEIQKCMKCYHVNRHITSCHLFSVSVIDKLIVYQWLCVKYHKMWFFHSFCHKIYIKWWKVSHVSTLNHLSWHVASFCEQEVECVYKLFATYLPNSHFPQENHICNWWKPYHVTTPITCQNMWTVTVIQKLHVLWPISVNNWEKINFVDFCPDYTSTLTKTLLFSYYTSLVITFRAYLYEIMHCFPPICNISCQISCSSKKWNW